MKYALRGYAIAVPGMESVDVDLSKTFGIPLSKLKGLARLVRLAIAFGDSHDPGGDIESPFRKLGNPYENDRYPYEKKHAAAAVDEDALEFCMDSKSCSANYFGAANSNQEGARNNVTATRKGLETTIKLSLGEVEFARPAYST